MFIKKFRHNIKEKAGIFKLSKEGFSFNSDKMLMLASITLSDGEMEGHHNHPESHQLHSLGHLAMCGFKGVAGVARAFPEI